MKKLLLLFGIFFGMLLSTQEVKSQDYEFAAGLRAGFGFSATGKMSLDGTNALEGIVNFRSFNSGVFKYNWIRIVGLYEIHNDLSSVTEGFYWYYGGGATVGFYGGDYSLVPGESFTSAFVGVVGVIGVDYTFPTAPINLSLDWIPSITFGGGGGFNTGGGGLAIRYVF
ncbi:MAG: hypothetical protein AAGK97_04470 [Bacteroidota bacterium]